MESDRYKEFTAHIAARLSKGEEEYEDKSFDNSFVSLVGEMEEELFDVCGWSYILWTKLDSLKRRIEELDS